MRWFGHLVRLHEDSPAQRAFAYARKPIMLPRGKPKTTWLKSMTNQLQEYGLSLDEAILKAQDRGVWRSLIREGRNVH